MPEIQKEESFSSKKLPSHAKVVVIGGGVAGLHAADMAVGLGADVTILDRSVPRLREIENMYGGRIRTQYSTIQAVDTLVPDADLVIGAVLVAGAAAPKLVSAEQVSRMRAGAVLVDISIDQGGCFETSKPTTHNDPVYIVDDIVHYCVANMPGAVSMTSAHALNNAVLPYALQLADKCWKRALAENPALMQGLNVCKGEVTYKCVAEEFGLNYSEPEKLAA